MGCARKITTLKIFERYLQKPEQVDVAIQMIWLCHKVGHHAIFAQGVARYKFGRNLKSGKKHVRFFCPQSFNVYVHILVVEMVKINGTAGEKIQLLMNPTILIVKVIKGKN